MHKKSISPQTSSTNNIEPFFLLLCQIILKTQIIRYKSQKSQKCALYYMRNLRKNRLHAHILFKISPTMDRFPRVLKCNKHTRLSGTKVKIVSHYIAGIWAKIGFFGSKHDILLGKGGGGVVSGTKVKIVFHISGAIWANIDFFGLKTR